MRCLAGVLIVASVAAAQEPLERIGIRPGEEGAQFVLKESETPFFVKGFNYVRGKSMTLLRPEVGRE